MLISVVLNLLLLLIHHFWRRRAQQQVYIFVPLYMHPFTFAFFGRYVSRFIATSKKMDGRPLPQIPDSDWAHKHEIFHNNRPLQASFHIIVCPHN